jgi:hypothetical protein
MEGSARRPGIALITMGRQPHHPPLAERLPIRHPASENPRPWRIG